LIQRITVGLLLGISLLACSHAKVNMSMKDTAVHADDYNAALTHWTRGKRVYENVESRLFVKATLHSWAFRQSQIAYRTKREELHHGDVETLKTDNRKDAEQWIEFFVAAHTHEWYWNRLENRSKDALWRIRLLNDKGVAISPSQVNRLGSDDPKYRILYPYYQDFYVAYRVRFPLKDTEGREIIGKDVSKLTLRIGGSPAVVNLNWDLTQ